LFNKYENIFDGSELFFEDIYRIPIFTSMYVYLSQVWWVTYLL